jgi:NADPH:quinone reductase-like Zn-dependent oxidoreductase
MVATAAAGASTGRATMRALVRERYGPPEVLRIAEVPKPEVVDDGVLVRVLATSVNRGDWYALAGKPVLARAMMGGIRRPKSEYLGTDFAGVVEAVGDDVHDLVPGDAVFGGKSGAFAEYVCVRQGVARKPEHVSFEEAAAVPVAALTALQALRDKAGLREGQRVLVNGASGGVGTFAVQIAKALGAAEVTASSTTRARISRRRAAATTCCSRTQARSRGRQRVASSHRTGRWCSSARSSRARCSGPSGTSPGSASPRFAASRGQCSSSRSSAVRT